MNDNRTFSGGRYWRRYICEALGTFAIVFAGCGAIISDGLSGGAVTHCGIAATFGLVVAAMIWALGPISAAHFNPAVTLGFACARRFPWPQVPAYVVAQLVGALLASALHQLFYDSAAIDAKFGATIPKVSLMSALGFEIVLSFLLMLVIMAVATDKRASLTTAGLAIGATVTLDALFGGPSTGASMNPARSLAPALFARGEAWQFLPLYLFAPTVGAVLAALCFEALREESEHARNAPADWKI